MFCSNEVTPCVFLDGGCSPERPSHEEKRGICSLTPLSAEKGERLEMASVIDHTYVRKPP